MLGRWENKNERTLTCSSLLECPLPDPLIAVNGVFCSTLVGRQLVLANTPLAHLYLSLYNIVHHKNITIAQVLAQTPLNITFRRVLSGNKWTA
jgi:hypothetical protein